MKLEFTEDDLVAACITVVILGMMLLGYNGCRENNRHTEWQQEHSITNK